jgi:KDO2-lipid IV(A) lauroyltransferase
MKPQKRFKYILEYFGLRLVFAILRCIPFQRCMALAERLGKLLYLLNTKHRNRAMDNLRNAFPEKSEWELVQILRQVYISLCRVTIEFAHLSEVEEMLAKGQIKVKGLDAWARALEQKKGIIGVTGHLGNWELLGAIMVHLGYPLHALYHPMKNPYSDRFFNHLRERAGIRLINMKKASWPCLRALKQNHIIGLIADQDAGRDGVFVDFFGRPASTFRGPAIFALKTGAPMAMGNLIRKADGTYTLYLEPPFKVVDTGDFEADVRSNTELWSRRLEYWVSRYPEQWFWVHRRWRRRPVIDGGVEPQPRHIGSNIKRVLVVRFSSLGDVTLIHPVLKKLYDQGYSVDLLTKESYREIFSYNPYINETMALENYKSLFHLLYEIYVRDYFRIIDLHKNLRAGIIKLMFLGRTVSYHNYRLKRFLLVNLKLNFLKHNSVAANYLNTLDRIDIHTNGRDRIYRIFHRSRALPDAVSDNGYVVVSPFARYNTKEWVYYKELIEIISHKYKVFILGELHDDQRANAYLTHNVLNLCGQLGFNDIMALIDHSVLLVTNDSGLMHLGAGTGTPTISFFGSTVPEFGFVPARDGVTVIQDPSLSCRPCHYHGRKACPEGHFACMRNLTMDVTMAKVREYIEI